MKTLLVIIASVLMVGCATRVIPSEQDPTRPYTTTTCTGKEIAGALRVDCKTVPGVAVAKLPVPDGRCDIEYRFQKFGIVSGSMYNDIVPDVCKELRIQQLLQEAEPK